MVTSKYPLPSASFQLGPNAVTAALLALFVFVVIPSQTYLGSPGLFDYSYLQLVSAGVLGAVVLAAVSFGILILLGRLIGTAAPVMGLALVICLYFEAGLLSIGLPAINGVCGFGNLIRGGFDCVAWMAVFVLFFLFRDFVGRNFGWFVVSLVGMMVLSVFDASGGAKVGHSSPLADGFCPTYDVVKSVRFSKQRNIMVYILDMTPATIMTDVMERCPELKSRFSGFTCFRKNLCMHYCTEEGVPALMTGLYLTSADDRAEYDMTDLGDGSFLFPYVLSSNDVYYAGAAHSFGYTNRRTFVSPPAKSTVARKGENVLERHSRSSPNLRMRDAILIRISPYLLKDYFYFQALHAANGFRPSTPNALKEDVTYPILEKAPLSDSSLALSVIHTCAIHWPISFDRFGHPLENPLTMSYGGDLTSVETVPYREAMREAGVWVMTRLSRLFDVLKEKGVYDNSTIILVADHGCVVMKEGQNNGSESGILWVKPENARGPFRYSDAPTTNAKVHDLVCKLKDSPLDSFQIETELSSPVRIFRADFRGKMLHSIGFKLRYTDWVYDKGANLVEVRHMRE